MNFDSIWHQLIYGSVYYGLQPLVAVLKRDSFFYWPYLLSFALVSVLLFWLKREYVVGAFSKAVWWCASSRADYRFYFINGILYPLTLGAVLFSVATLGEGIADGLSALFGPMSLGEVDHFWLVASYTVFYFLFYDFGRFLAHWVQHKWDLLWQFHQLHHSAEVLTPFTSFRVHPVDLVVMSLGETLFASLIFGLYQWLFPDQFGFAVFLGSHVLLVAYRFLGNLRHSHVWLSYGPLNRVLVSPAMHQIHHSYLLEHRDKNMGFALSIWDQLFGTAYIPQRRETFPMGLGDGQDDGRWHVLWRMYWEPLKGFGQKVMKKPEEQAKKMADRFAEAAQISQKGRK